MQQVDKENLEKLGQKINELRLLKSSSLNQFVLSNGCTTTATWSRVENGLVDLKFSTLLKFAHALGVTVDELLKGINFDYNFSDE